MPSWIKAIDFYANDIKPDKLREKTVTLVKKFIPHELRTKVWPLAFENRLGITNGLYIELLEKRTQKWVTQKVVNQIGIS